MKRNRIQTVSIVMIVLISLFGLFWAIEYSYRLGVHLFVKDWSTFPMVDDGFVMTTGRMLLACLYYSPVYIVSFSAIGSALLLFNRYRQGFIFDQRTSLYLIAVGISLIGIFAFDTIISATELSFMSHWNADGAVAIRYKYDPSDIVIAISGIGFCLLGWISREALRLKLENDSFV